MSKYHNKKYYINNEIRTSKVRCIDKDNQNIGIIPTKQAIFLAFESGLDLVQINNAKDKIPTCKIIDYGKYKYEISKKEKYQAKKNREAIIKTKEIRFRPNTNENDLLIKSRQAAKFLADGCKVKIMVIMKGRETSYKHMVIDKLNYFTSMVCELTLLENIEIRNEKFFNDNKVLSLLLSIENNKKVESSE